jgi:hypothetical protein
MKRRLLTALIALGLLASAAPPQALAGVAMIETTAPLVERSEAAIKAAVLVAIDKAVKGAIAMGYPWVQFREAQIAGDVVAVQILATDVEPEGSSATPPGEPEANDDPDPDGESATEDGVPVTTRLNI